MIDSEKKPRQNTGNHPDPLSEYPEARKRLESCADYPNARRPDGVLVSTVRCDDLRTLLAGPPEPSKEEIARTLYPEAFLWGGDPTVALKAAAMVQALFRSRRA